MFDFKFESVIPGAAVAPEVIKDFIGLVNSLTGVPKNGTVKYGATEFKYATIDDINSKIKSSEKWSILTPCQMDGDSGTMTAILLHESGAMVQSPEFGFRLTSTKPQDRAAQMTYARRYVLSSFLNIAADDDIDGADPAGVQMPIRRTASTAAPTASEPTAERKKIKADFIREAEDLIYRGNKLGGCNHKALTFIAADETAAERIRRAASFLLNNKSFDTTEMEA